MGDGVLKQPIKSNWPKSRRTVPYHGILWYFKGSGELWYYDENGNFVLSTHNRRGVRRGCILGMFVFCLTTEPVYTRLREAMGEHGTLYAYSDDSYRLQNRTRWQRSLHKPRLSTGRLACKSATVLARQS